MHFAAVAAALLAGAIASVTGTAIALLRALDSAPADAIDPLLHGDFGPMFCSGWFWSGFPAVDLDVSLAMPGPALFALAIATGLWFAHARLGWSWTTTASLALLSAAPLWFAGAVALHGNTDPTLAGPWLLWMLGGAFHASLAAIAFAALGALPARRAPTGPLVPMAIAARASADGR